MIRGSSLVALALVASACLGQGAKTTPVELRIDAAESAAAWFEGWTMEDPRLSQPVIPGVIEDAFKIRAADGLNLDAWVMRPRTDIPVPTILRLSPYFDSPDRHEDSQGWPYDRDWVARGYAVTYVSVRGTDQSDGCLDWQGMRDRADVPFILDAIVQKSWSDGNIGGIGISWEGTTLNSAILAGHPALKTVVPGAAISDWHRWPLLNGVPWSYAGYTWNLYSWPLQAWDDRTRGIQHSACVNQLEAQMTGLRTGPTGLRDGWWDERNMSLHTDKVRPDIAVLLVHGYLDLGVRPDHLPHWVQALEAKGVRPHMVLGQWGHVWPNMTSYNDTTVLRSTHFLKEWNVTLLRWFDHWLKGKDTGIASMPRVLTQDSFGRVHAQDALTPTKGNRTKLYLAGGSLAGSPGSGSATFVDNGAFPGPRRGPQAIFFATEPAMETYRVPGEAFLRLRLQHTALHGHVAATLYDVYGDTWKPLSIGFANYNLRNSMYVYEPVRPDETFDVTVPLLPHDFVIRAGHRLGLAVGTQAQYEGYQGGDTPFGAMMPAPSGGITTVHFGSGAFLDLPVVAYG